jgi:hypothetical protein
MNKTLFVTCLLALSIASRAQTLKDFFANEAAPTTFLGIDFSQARLINDPGGNPSGMVDKVFPSINDLMIKEAKKYDVGSAFRHKTMDHDFTGVTKDNAAINADALRSGNTADATRLKEADIKALVGHLDMGGKKGIGILFVVEGMDKTDKKVTAWVAIINMDTHTVLFTERVDGKTGNGFGERNFWASGIKSCIDDVDSPRYKQWKKRFS